MVSSHSNQKPLTPERDLPKQLMLGRSLMAVAALLAIGLLVGGRSLAPLTAIVASTIAFPVLIELRTLTRAGSGELRGEPWGIDAVSVLTTSVCILGMSFVSPFAAWAVAWLVVGVLGALGRRASR